MFYWSYKMIFNLGQICFPKQLLILDGGSNIE